MLKRTFKIGNSRKMINPKHQAMVAHLQTQGMEVLQKIKELQVHPKIQAQADQTKIQAMEGHPKIQDLVPNAKGDPWKSVLRVVQPRAMPTVSLLVERNVETNLIQTFFS